MYLLISRLYIHAFVYVTYTGTVQQSMWMHRKLLQLVCLGVIIILTMGLWLRKTSPVVNLSTRAQDQEVKATIAKRYLLLVTNKRSGSSFTSALLSQHPDVFYWFEPLYPLEKTEKRKPDVFWLNSNEKESVEILEDHFSCKPKGRTSLLNLQMKNSDHTTDAFYCFKKNRGRFGLIECYNKLTSECLSRPLTFIKTVRLPVRFARYFLDKYPDFKLIYLIRDPRAVMFSQFKVFHEFKFKSSTQLENRTRTFCNSITDDLHHLHDLNKRFPGKVMAIRYEDGALEPMTYAESIYNFVGLSFTDDVKKHVKEMTSGNKKTDEKSYRFSVYRENGTQTMNKWRKKITIQWTAILDRLCSQFYPDVGYKKIESKQELKSEKSIVNTPPKDSLFYRDNLSR